ncbi:Uncharacterised protein [Oligella urethralis]|uniref:hypothetical protein n=1 Tax=Oligella urethralis TaxID=90245 RepID=UPI000E023F18|nr:hypothetical protein [Oligella urethralis]SUA63380.1 Uncharacterised protein [Oligella urethralis]
MTMAYDGVLLDTRLQVYCSFSYHLIKECKEEIEEIIQSSLFRVIVSHSYNYVLNTTRARYSLTQLMLAIKDLERRFITVKMPVSIHARLHFDYPEIFEYLSLYQSIFYINKSGKEVLRYTSPNETFIPNGISPEIQELYRIHFQQDSGLAQVNRRKLLLAKDLIK